jgi:hypothetical protein
MTASQNVGWFFVFVCFVFVCFICLFFFVLFVCFFDCFFFFFFFSCWRKVHLDRIRQPYEIHLIQYTAL